MSQLTSALANTWRGLLQRRLWPVAVLLLAGLVAVPLLLTARPEPVPPPVAAGDEASELAARPLVAVASAAERESARRVLGARKDPFKPSNQPKARKARKSGDDAASGSGGSASAGSKASGGAPAPGSGVSGHVAPPPLPSSKPDATSRRRPAGSLSVRWGTAGDEQLETLAVERLDPLPTADEPLLVFLGLTDDGRKAVLMLDAGVTVDGDGRCRPTPGDCHTVELAPGETLLIEVISDDDDQPKAQYRLDLVKIHGRRAARTPSKDAAAQARATRRVLASLDRPAPAYRFDARTGRLERVGTGDEAAPAVATGD